MLKTTRNPANTGRMRNCRPTGFAVPRAWRTLRSVTISCENGIQVHGWRGPAIKSEEPWGWGTPQPVDDGVTLAGACGGPDAVRVCSCRRRTLAADGVQHGASTARAPASAQAHVDRSDRLAFRYGRAAGGDASNARRHASAHLDGGAHARGDAAGDSDPRSDSRARAGDARANARRDPDPRTDPRRGRTATREHACDRFVHQCASRTAGRRAARPDVAPARGLLPRRLDDRVALRLPGHLHDGRAGLPLPGPHHRRCATARPALRRPERCAGRDPGAAPDRRCRPADAAVRWQLPRTDAARARRRVRGAGAAARTVALPRSADRLDRARRQREALRAVPR